MIKVEKRMYEAIWGLIWVLLAAGWAAFFILDHGSDLYLAVMVALTILLGGGAAVLLERRGEAAGEEAKPGE